jgi:hypothetical protein
MARLLAALLAATLPAVAARAGDPPLPRDAEGHYLVDLKVGERYPICRSGALICPATVPICDHLGIATMDLGKEGLEIVAVSPGRTLCSARSANELRAVFRITVR